MIIIIADLEVHITIGEPMFQVITTGLLQKVLHNIRGEPQETNLSGLKSK